MKWLLCTLCIFCLLSVAFAQQTPPNYHLVKKLAIGGDGGWDYLTFDSVAKRLYISRSSRVTVVDVTKDGKDAIVGEIPNTPGVHGIALVPGVKRGFTSNGWDNTVTVFDMETLKEVSRVKVGTRPDAILFDSASNRVFTFNGGSNDATVIDAATAQVVGTIALGGRPEYPAADGKGMIYDNIEDKNEIVAIDAKAMTVKSHWSLAPGEGPSGLAMDQKNHRLFSVCANQKMIVLNADTGKVLATLAIGKGADAAVFDGSASLAFSSNGGEGTMTVVREGTPDTFTVVATVPTQVSARTMALDAGSHMIYLAAALFAAQPAGAPAAPGVHRRPALEANTFVILVFGP